MLFSFLDDKVDDMDLSADSVLSDIDPIIGGVLSDDGTPGSQFIPPTNTEEQTDYVEMMMDYVSFLGGLFGLIVFSAISCHKLIKY